MSANNNGGPAFPGIRIEAGDNYNPPKQIHRSGMSLRDYFAAKALQGLLASLDSEDTVQGVAQAAYSMADAMLKARIET